MYSQMSDKLFEEFLGWRTILYACVLILVFVGILVISRIYIELTDHWFAQMMYNISDWFLSNIGAVFVLAGIFVAGYWLFRISSYVGE